MLGAKKCVEHCVKQCNGNEKQFAEVAPLLLDVRCVVCCIMLFAMLWLGCWLVFLSGVDFCAW